MIFNINWIFLASKNRWIVIINTNYIKQNKWYDEILTSTIVFLVKVGSSRYNYIHDQITIFSSDRSEINYFSNLSNYLTCHKMKI